ncbi:hypothetical protein K0U83_24160 [bacterium]|jgi:hypothetical protein|nr:hypothetical protein [bacterium]
MANLFVLNVAGMVAPLAADKNANRLIGLAVQRLAGDAAPAAVEVPDGDALRAALFTRVAAGEVAAADAAAELKAIDAQIAAAVAASKAEPAVLLLAGEPATGAEIKRAFRGAESGTSVEIASLDGERTGAITMFRV